MPTTPFLNMFGCSPIGPLEAHMAKVNACVENLMPFFDAAFAQNWHEVEVQQKNISRLEQEADDMKRDLRLRLPKSLLMPISRSDLLELLNFQDRLANKTKDIARIILGRKMVFPQQISNLFLEFLSRCIEASRQANTAIHELHELLETSFSGKEVKLIESMIAKLDHIQRDTDQQQIQLRHIIFGLEDSLPPVHVIFIYKIIEWTGDLANRAQDIGDRLQILLAR